jgi:nucleotide-binding universal stress UspA family protein
MGAAFVAMATHGRTGVARFVFGSVAEQFLHECKCPLITVSVAPTHSIEYEEKYLG